MTSFFFAVSTVLGTQKKPAGTILYNLTGGGSPTHRGVLGFIQNSIENLTKMSSWGNSDSKFKFSIYFNTTKLIYFLLF